MNTGFIESDSDKWRECLVNPDAEFYQKPEFAELETELSGGSALAWYGEEHGRWILIPLVRRPIPDSRTGGRELFDLVSPYGYPGILCSRNCSPDTLNRLLELFSSHALEQGYVSTFLRLNPITNPFILDETDDRRQVIHGKVVLIDLEQGYSRQKSKYSSNHRRNIKKLLKAGISVEWNNWGEIGSFITLYNETMEREEASDYYFFPPEYYTTLREMQDDESIDLLIARDPDGEPVAGGIFCNNGEIVQYHLGGTKSDVLRQAPSKLLFDRMIQKYSKKARYFNLGGGVGSSDDSLFRFKSGFAKEYRKFSTLRVVHDRQRYNNLCRDYSKEELYDLESYFPLYRS